MVEIHPDDYEPKASGTPSFVPDFEVMRSRDRHDEIRKPDLRGSADGFNALLKTALSAYKELPPFEVRYGGYLASFDGKELSLTDESEDEDDDGLRLFRSSIPATFSDFLVRVESRIKEMLEREGKVLDTVETIETANLALLRGVSGKELAITRVEQGQLAVSIENGIPVLAYRGMDTDTETIVTEPRMIARRVSGEEVRSIYKKAGETWEVEFDFDS